MTWICTCESAWLFWADPDPWEYLCTGTWTHGSSTCNDTGTHEYTHIAEEQQYSSQMIKYLVIIAWHKMILHTCYTYSTHKVSLLCYLHQQIVHFALYWPPIVTNITIWPRGSKNFFSWPHAIKFVDSKILADHHPPSKKFKFAYVVTDLVYTST